MISVLNDQLRRIILAGDIRQETAQDFLEQITAFECIDISRPITIYVDTYGGSVDSALCIYDIMRSCVCPIVTVGVGKVMSAGVLILAAGDKGSRFITENTRVMIHEVSSGTVGTISEMSNSVNEIKRLQDTYNIILSRETGTSKEKIADDMKKDYYMSADAAIKYGIVDKMVPMQKSAKAEKVSKSKVQTKTTKKVKTKVDKPVKQVRKSTKKKN